MTEMNKEALKAWKALSDSEAEKYRKEAEKSRPSKRLSGPKKSYLPAAHPTNLRCWLKYYVERVS